MQIIDIGTGDHYKVHFKPLFVVKDEIITVKTELQNEERESPIFFEGFYKFDISGKFLNKINIQTPITYYTYSDIFKIIYYTFVEEYEKLFIIHFYELNTITETNKKFAEYSLNKYWEEEPYKEHPEMVRHRLTPYALSNNFIMCLKDEIYQANECYNHLENTNEYELFLHNTENSENYQVLDKSIFDNGIKYTDVFTLDNNEYLLIKASMLYSHDKKNTWYLNQNGNGFKKFRGSRDSIKLIFLNDFIERVKRGENRLSYNEIEVQEQSGSINFIKRIESKIYYEIISLNKQKNELVCYDIRDSLFERYDIPDEYTYLVSSLHNIYALVEKDDYIELIGVNKNDKIIRYPKNIGKFQAVFDGGYIITEKNEIIDNKIGGCCIIFNTNSMTIEKTIPGKADIFENEGIIVIY